MKPSPSLADAPLVDHWLVIEPDGTVLVYTGKVEIGQHVGHALGLIVAEELRVPLALVTVCTADTARSPDEGYTSGSNSIAHSGGALRAAAATARRVLIARAARKFGVDEKQVSIDDGLLRNAAGNVAINFAEAMEGAPFDVAVDASAPSVTSAPRPMVGHTTSVRGLAGLVTGTSEFVHDLAWPNMLHARVVRPPHYHARLRTPLPRIEGDDEHSVFYDGSFVAVAGADEHVVVTAAKRLESKLTWDLGAGLDTRDPFALLYSSARHSRAVLDGTPVEGPVTPHAKPPQSTTKTVSAKFEREYQMHGSLGPSAAGALFENGKLTLWSATQGIFPLRGAVAETLGLATEDVRVIHVPGAGCYGHNGADDASLDAALVARAYPGRHVLLKWNREQEHAWEPYSPCMGVELRASLNADGEVVHWCHDVYGDTHRARPRPGPGGVGPSRLLAARHIAEAFPPYVPTPNMARHAGNHRNADPIYAFPERSIIKHLVPGLPLRTSAMRTLGAFANVFAIESFMDELAAAADSDALAFRLRHLTDPRARRVLERAAELSGWPGASLPAGEALGLGMAQYKNAQTYAAVCVHLSVDDSARVRLRSAWIVADAGRVIDPDGLEAQLEGGFVQAASWALFESVQYDQDGITSRDWDSYRVARFSDLPAGGDLDTDIDQSGASRAQAPEPDIHVELIDQPTLPSLGAGEASSGPAGAAIANAIARATSVRPRRIPFTPQNLRAAALAS